MRKRFYIGGIAVIVFLFAGLLGYHLKTQPSLGKADNQFVHKASNVVGTRIATTTTGVAFDVLASGGQSATTSYISLVSNGSIAEYNFLTLAASSTSNIHFDIQGSQDDGCNTTATSSTDVAYDSNLATITSEINWFSVGDHLKDTAHSTTLNTNTSSTKSFAIVNPTPGTNGQEVILTNLNYECLKLNISGSSTVEYVQLRTRQ